MSTETKCGTENHEFLWSEGCSRNCAIEGGILTASGLLLADTTALVPPSPRSAISAISSLLLSLTSAGPGMGHHSEEILASRDVPLLQGDALWPASLSILLQLKFGGFFLPWEHFPELPSFHTSLPGPFVCHRYHPTPG